MEGGKRLTVDVVIPVYRPGKKFGQLLDMLMAQTYPIEKVIIMNTERAFWKDKKYEGIRGLEVHHVAKEEFDHGGTRNAGASHATADIMVFMTDDAVPADRKMVARLAEAFMAKKRGQEQVALAYGRQLPGPGAGLLEQYARYFNYPKEGRIKTRKDLPALGIKTYFASNVCCAYDRQVFCQLGGFVSRTIFNEDMIYACQAIKAGYAIAYVPGARVVHSHHYTCMEQFRRNFDMAVSQADHPEVFAGLPPEGEGIRLVKETARRLARGRKPWLIFSLAAVSGFKYMGYLAGKRYGKLPRPLVAWCSMNREYWKRKQGST